MKELLLTGFYTGHLPLSPGSWASWGAACSVAIVSSFLPGYTMVISLAGFGFFFLAGLVLLNGGQIENLKKKAGFIVIDEWAGQCLVFMLVEMTLLNLILGFIFFRIVTSWRTWPIEHLSKLGEGLAIMVDDLVAGLYGALALWALNLLYGVVTYL